MIPHLISIYPATSHVQALAEKLLIAHVTASGLDAFSDYTNDAQLAFKLSRAFIEQAKKEVP